MKQETLEEIKVIKRTELYNSILSIVKQIPRKEVDGDAIDAPSCAYELEQLFLKWQQERSYSEEDLKLLLKKFKKDIINSTELDDDFETLVCDIETNKWFEQFKKK